MKELGQYFTISNHLQQFIFDRVKHKSSCLLEPSFGAGHLLQKFKEYNVNYPMVCYELDSHIPPLLSFNEHQTIMYGDFLQQKITRTFKTIIGNPPFIKQKTGNLYLKFIELCYQYLEPDGELLFIVPSDFIKLTSSSSLLHEMTQHGSFTHFLFPHDEKLFEGASIDVVVFRYEKGLLSNKTIMNGQDVFCNVNHGIITFSETEVSGISLDTLFHVYVGLVSGRDEIYRVGFGNMDMLIDKGKVAKYIFTETFPTSSPEINTHLHNHKQELLDRRIKKFSEKNWFEWGAPRNISSIRKHWGRPCIYVRNMTRQEEVAFVGTVQYFGGALLCLVPKETLDMARIVEYLNTPTFKKDYLYAGRFKIGHKQISTAIVSYGNNSSISA